MKTEGPEMILVALFTVLFYGWLCETAQTRENMANNATFKPSPA
jgi:hypothetical protein